jgi:uncharacterized protein
VTLAGEIVIGVVMAVGVVGVVVPVLPGLVLIGGAAIFWAFAEGTATAWAVAVAMIAILALGTFLKYRLPGRELKAQEVPSRTWTLVAIGGIAGFFIVPVVGALLGVVVGAYVGELLRFRSHGPAWASAKRVLIGIGKGMAVEFGAGLVAVALWFGTVLAT